MHIYNQLKNSISCNYWEDAAIKTTSVLFDSIKNHLDIYNDKLLSVSYKRLDGDDIYNMQQIVDYMIDNKIWENEPHPLIKVTPTEDIARMQNAYASLWVALSICSVAKSIDIDPNFDINDYKNWIKTVVVKKQKDYGPNNISRFGLNGLVIRIHDKIARLENLVSKKSSAQNEPLNDTLLDIIGYSVVAIMWIMGTFLYPLKSEFVQKNLSEEEFFYSIDESPINRHSKIPVTSASNHDLNMNYTIYDSRGNKVKNTYSITSGTHPNPKFQ